MREGADEKLAENPEKDKMWTEITKDLVSEEALKEAGKEYEENSDFYYVMEHLRYVCSSKHPIPSIQFMMFRHSPLFPCPDMGDPV